MRQRKGAEWGRMGPDAADGGGWGRWGRWGRMESAPPAEGRLAGVQSSGLGAADALVAAAGVAPACAALRVTVKVLPTCFSLRTVASPP